MAMSLSPELMGNIVHTIREATKQLQESPVGSGEIAALYDSIDPKAFNLAYFVGVMEGFAITMFRISEGRNVNDEERNDIHKLVRDNIEDVKNLIENTDLQ